MPQRKRKKRKLTVQPGAVLGEAELKEIGGSTKKKKRRRKNPDIEFEGLAPEELGRVCVAAGLTKNMDDFDSAKVFVSVSLPSAPDEESMSQTKARCSHMLDSWLQEEYATAVEMFNEEDDD